MLDTLDRLKLSDNTLIFYASDNGGVLRFGATMAPGAVRRSTCMRAACGSGGLLAGEIRPGSVIDRIVLTMDIFGSACEAAGVKPPPGIDAMSFLPDLFGHPQHDSRPNYYFVRREGNLRYNGDVIEALIQGDWKLVKDNPSSPFELFDLKSDPLESLDLTGREHEKFAALSASSANIFSSAAKRRGKKRLRLITDAKLRARFRTMWHSRPRLRNDNHSRGRLCHMGAGRRWKGFRNGALN